MGYDPDKHHRRSIRLKGHDYAQPGAYFVTACTHERASLFGHVVSGEMHLNEAGEMAQGCWEDIPTHFPLVELDAFVVMPNHIHGVIVILGRGEKSFAPTRCGTSIPTGTTTMPQPPSKTIGSIVRGFKIGVTKWFRANTDVYSVWQRGFYEHIVRSEQELTAIRQYVQANPARWDEDENNPHRQMP
jgi:putative transposase